MWFPQRFQMNGEFRLSTFAFLDPPVQVEMHIIFAMCLLWLGIFLNISPFVAAWGPSMLVWLSIFWHLRVFFRKSKTILDNSSLQYPADIYCFWFSGHPHLWCFWLQANPSNFRRAFPWKKRWFSNQASAGIMNTGIFGVLLKLSIVSNQPCWNFAVTTVQGFGARVYYQQRQLDSKVGHQSTLLFQLLLACRAVSLGVKTLGLCRPPKHLNKWITSGRDLFNQIAFCLICVVYPSLRLTFWETEVWHNTEDVCHGFNRAYVLTLTSFCGVLNCDGLPNENLQIV